MEATRLLPETRDFDTGGFWQGAREGELRILECTSCGTILHLPSPVCHECGSWELGWKGVSNEGHLHAWIVVEHQVHPAFPVPYTVVLVDVDDVPGVRLIGYLDGAPELVPGQAMRARFEMVNGEVALPQWDPV